MYKHIFALSIFLYVAVSSCKNDDDGTNPPDEDLLISKNFSIEESETHFKQNAISFFYKINNFNSNSNLDNVIELAKAKFSNKPKTANPFQKFVFESIENIKNAASYNTNLVEFNALQTAAVLIRHEHNNLLQEFDREKGIYEYNNITNTFETIGKSDHLVYNINHNGKKGVFSIIHFNSLARDEYNDDIPTRLISEFKIDNKLIFRQNYSASVEADNFLPHSYYNALSLGDFDLTTSLTNRKDHITTKSLTIKSDNKTLFNLNLDSKENVIDFDHNTSLKNPAVQNTFRTDDYSMKFLDAKIAVSATNTNFNYKEELSIANQIDFLNKNTDVKLYFGSNLIAKGQFYEDKKENIYLIYDTNGDGKTTRKEIFNKPNKEVVIEKIVNLKFLFNNGKTTDFDTYFEGSLTKTKNKFTKTFTNYENKFKKTYN